MRMHEVMTISRIVGQGLCYDDNYLTLEETSRQTGWFCHFSHDDTSGVWFSHQNWLDFVLHHTGTSQDDMLDKELWDCLFAHYLSQWDSINIASLSNESVRAMSVSAGIYPVIRNASYAFTLINLTPERLQSAIEQWEDFSGDEIQCNAQLIAGWHQLTPLNLNNMQSGDALWLQGDIHPEKGECILWWQGPVALLKADSDPPHHFMVKETYSDIHFNLPPILAKTGYINLPLSVISRLTVNQLLETKPQFHDQITLTDAKRLLCHASLLRSADGLLAHIHKFL